MQSQTMGDEVPFAFAELFFSRTDEHGIIQSGNGVFQRVSGYSWDELLKKPHKIIRHPDMPRAVFWLLWNTIAQGKPIGAYVKNRAKDGRYYWVFALITPAQGGYLSVRLKPSSPLFHIVEKEYAALEARERAESLKPADSAALLLQRLAELGFRDYDAFMSSALSGELIARANILNGPADERVDRFTNIQSAAMSLMDEANKIFSAFAENAYVSLNFQVQAAKLGQAGAAIGEISRNYDDISGSIRHNMESFVASAAEVAGTVSEGLFLFAGARLQQEVQGYFAREESEDESIRARDVECLDEQANTYHRKAVDGLVRISARVVGFGGEIAYMKRLVTGLEVTRIMGKVESARLNLLEHGLDGLIDELENLQRAIAAGLKAINNLNLRVQRDAKLLLEGVAA